MSKDEAMEELRHLVIVFIATGLLVAGLAVALAATVPLNGGF